MPIRCQSLANPCQSDSNPEPIQGQSTPILSQSCANRGQIFRFANIFQFANHSQSDPICANPVPIHANLMPIGRQFFFVMTQIRQFANASQSDPIRANPEPIWCLSANPLPISQPVQIGHSGVNRSIQCQSANLVPILCQSDANPAPIFRLDTNSPICQSWPI